jgi:uncharacterized membrane protein YhaH (DUF805 family)
MSELAREFEAALVVGEEKAVAEAKRWNRIGYAVLAGTFGVALLWSSLAPCRRRWWPRGRSRWTAAARRSSTRRAGW